MDWLSILQQIFELCIIPLLGIVTKFVIEYIAQKKGNDSTGEMLENFKRSVQVQYRHRKLACFKDHIVGKI